MQAVVLLAAYNGARYLPEQLDSIFTQSHRPLTLLALDDGSSDATPALLRDAERRSRGALRCVYLGQNPVNLGAPQSFARLLDYALRNERELGLGDYLIALADQDDRWHEDRLAYGVARLEGVADRPALAHSDLAVVDVEGRQIHPSLVRYQGLAPRRCGFSELLLSNCVTGCSATLTPALARLALPIPAAAMMHDWWLALTASLFGNIDYIDRALLDYRQHGGNAVGARPREAWPVLGRLKQLRSASIDAQLRERAAQARAARERFGARLDRRQRLACELVYLQRFNSVPLRLMTQLGARGLRAAQGV